MAKPMWAVLLAGVALLACPAVQAASQDPATFPAGMTAIHNTPARAGQDFEVAVTVDAADSVSVYVCHFASASADSPDVCYQPLGAKASGTTWTVSTAAGTHPAWRDGMALGYKVTAKSAHGESHAPISGEYYRIQVGHDEGPVPQGTAVVEDSPALPASESARRDSVGAPLGLFPLALGLAVALAFRRA